jgi:hypothetical protein
VESGKDGPRPDGEHREGKRGNGQVTGDEGTWGTGRERSSYDRCAGNPTAEFLVST